MRPATFDRRRFVQATAAGAAGALLPSLSLAADAKAPLAALGGKPVRSAPFPSWPIIEDNDRIAWEKVLDEKKWNRLNGKYTDAFERAYAEKMGSKFCVATANGTSALFASLNALGVGPGDEVIVPPYTFVATINVVLLQHALPVFVDSDPETFQIDARKVESAITSRTAALMPVHVGGSPADLDTLLKIAEKRSLPLVEDACQAHLGEWKGKKLGSLGKCGCFSFQASKNLNCGEGGAILTDDGDLAERCFAFHNQGRGRTGRRNNFTYANAGANLRLTEFQAVLLLQQMTRLEQQAKARDENAKYLTQLLEKIPGVTPAKNYAGCTRSAYHLYMFRYDKSRFAKASRAQFLKALRAEGIPCSGGYSPLNKEPFLKETLQSRAFRKIYTDQELKTYGERSHCPENDRLCEEAVWLTQNMLLGPRSDMEPIAEAIRKLQAHASELAKIT